MVFLKAAFFSFFFLRNVSKMLQCTFWFMTVASCSPVTNVKIFACGFDNISDETTGYAAFADQIRVVAKSYI